MVARRSHFDHRLGPADLILGAVPCEWLSVRRTRLNKVTDNEIERERQTLDAILQLVSDLAPPWWCLEDVTQLRKELPPMLPYTIIESSEFCAQRRKRLYAGKFPRPRARHNGTVLRDHLRPGPYRIGARSIDRKLVTSGAFSVDKAYSATPTRKSPTVCSITSRRDPELLVTEGPIGRRQMEWQELARLQGFPEDFVFFGSPTAVAKQIGQAIQIDTGRAILEAIVKEADLQ